MTWSACPCRDCARARREARQGRDVPAVVVVFLCAVGFPLLFYLSITFARHGWFGG